MDGEKLVAVTDSDGVGQPFVLRSIDVFEEIAFKVIDVDGGWSTGPPHDLLRGERILRSDLILAIHLVVNFLGSPRFPIRLSMCFELVTGTDGDRLVRIVILDSVSGDDIVSVYRLVRHFQQLAYAQTAAGDGNGTAVNEELDIPVHCTHLDCHEVCSVKHAAVKTAHCRGNRYL